MPELAYSSMPDRPLKPIEWLGSALADLRAMSRRRSDAHGIRVTRSSGNVFADLGLPEPEERLAKAQLAIEIGRILAQRKLTQQAAARLMGIDQPKDSHLLHGRLAGFSTERLRR